MCKLREGVTYLENSTKALLIAGAVLICIILISIGVFIVNNANNVISTSGDVSNTYSLEVWNKQFSVYEGKQSGRNVKKLLDTVITANSTKNANSIIEDIGIYCSDSDVLSQITDYETKRTLSGNRYYGVRYKQNILMVENAINNSSTYKISFELNDGGYVWKIHIDNVE